MIELTVLGCSGSYGAPAGRRVQRLPRARRRRDALARLRQRHARVVATARRPGRPHRGRHHARHPDHCVDLYGLHVLNRYGLERLGLPVYAPEGRRRRRCSTLVGDWGGAFDWHEVGDGDTREIGPVGLRFSRTDHPPPTVAVELAHDGHRLVYTADTGPEWSVDCFAPRRRPRALRGDLSARRHPRADPPLGPPGRRDGPRRVRPAG